MPVGLDIGHYNTSVSRGEELVASITGNTILQPVNSGISTEFPQVAQVGVAESMLVGSTNTFSSHFFEANWTSTTNVSGSNPPIAWNEATKSTWNTTSTVSRSSKTFNRVVQNLWFRPNEFNKTINIIDLNKDYINNQTIVTFCTTPNTNVTFLETGEFIMNQPSFGIEVYKTFPNPVGNKLMFNDSIINSKIPRPIYFEYFSNYGNWDSPFPYIDHNLTTVPTSSNYTSPEIRSNPHMNTQCFVLRLPDQVDVNKIFVSTSACYNYWNGANEMLGVSVKFMKATSAAPNILYGAYLNGTYHEGNYLVVKYWKRSLANRASNTIGLHMPKYTKNPNYDWNKSTQEGDGWTAYEERTNAFNGNYFLPISLCYFPNHN